VRVILRVLSTEFIRRPISLAFAIYPFVRCIGSRSPQPAASAGVSSAADVRNSFL
jgi:hypothetical protein